DRTEPPRGAGDGHRYRPRLRHDLCRQCGDLRRGRGAGRHDLGDRTLCRSALHRARLHDRDRGGSRQPRDRHPGRSRSRRGGAFRELHLRRRDPARLRFLAPRGDPDRAHPDAAPPAHGAAMRPASPILNLRGPRAAAVLVLGALALAAPFLFPSITTQIALLWLMVVFALTWDTTGGQMGYNSFGNVLFVGLGMYVCAVVQRDSGLGYFDALALGVAAGAVATTALGAVLGSGMLGLRGHYFAIGTLGLGIA